MNTNSGISDNFQRTILDAADQAKSLGDWYTAFTYYNCFLNKAFSNVCFPTDEFDFQYVPILFSCGECLLEYAKIENKINRFLINDIQNIDIYFESVRRTYEKSFDVEQLPFEIYCDHFNLLGNLFISINYLSSAYEIFNKGYEYSSEKENCLQININFLISKINVLDKQYKYKRAINEIKNCLKIIDDELSSTDDESIISFLNDSKKELLFENEKIKKDQQNKQKTFRPDDAPMHITFDRHIFTYSYSRKDCYIYDCKCGIDRHKKNRCRARISIQLITIDLFEEEYPITIINGEHTCDFEKSSIKQTISNAQLKELVETFYKTEPRPTRLQLINMIYKKLKKDSKSEDDIPSFSETLANSIYTNLEKERNSSDPNFNSTIKTSRGTSFELFKHRYHSDQSQDDDSYIICYSSEFQRSYITDSDFIFIDSTFDITPENYAQVLIIMGQTTNMNIPIAYFLLPNKTQETYDLAFSLFKVHLTNQFRSGVIFITDFEKAEIKSVKKNLMNDDSYLQLCYFHFTQSMARHFQKYPKTLFTKKLNHIANLLPFISEKKVHEVINELYMYNETKAFAKYFDKNYLTIYNFNDWSVYPKPQNQTITNNVVESHNNVLRQYLGKHRSLKDFEEMLSKIEDIYYNKNKYRKVSKPNIKRIDEDDFDIEYRKFILHLQRSNQISNFRTQTNTSNQTNTQLEITTDTEDDFFNDEISEIENIDITNSSDENDEPETEKRNDTGTSDDSNITFTTEKTQKASLIFRNLPSDAQEILLSNIKRYGTAPQRSREKREVLISVVDELAKLNLDFSIDQIRNWFNNNKDKSHF